MSDTRGASAPVSMPTEREVERAITFTYIQTVLKSVFWSATGGMFLVGFGLKLGADDTMLGVMTSVPTALIVTQILGGALTERGYNRKRLTIGFGLLVPASWFIIAALPLLGTEWAQAHVPLAGQLHGARLLVLIMMLAVANGALQISFSVRASWMGELIPDSRRGRFFGYSAMFSGIVGMVSAVGAGKCLDFLQAHGAAAFGGLFAFGALASVAWAILFVPQPDCPLPTEERHPRLWEMTLRTARNRPLVRLAFANALRTLGTISAPFIAAYLLRDVGVTYFQLGLLTAVGTIASLLSGPWWGRLAGRVGCRPVMMLGWVMSGTCLAVWAFVPPGASARALALLPLSNFIGGLGLSAANVAQSTIVYKASQPVGRSVQLALYYSFVILIGAPMPALGGWLVTTMRANGLPVDLRLTFLATMVFYGAASFAAAGIAEPGAVSLRALVLHRAPVRIARAVGVDLTRNAAYATMLRRLGARDVSADGAGAQEQG